MYRYTSKGYQFIEPDEPEEPTCDVCFGELVYLSIGEPYIEEWREETHSGRTFSVPYRRSPTEEELADGLRVVAARPGVTVDYTEPVIGCKRGCLESSDLRENDYSVIQVWQRLAGAQHDEREHGRQLEYLIEYAWWQLDGWSQAMGLVDYFRFLSPKELAALSNGWRNDIADLIASADSQEGQ